MMINKILLCCGIAAITACSQTPVLTSDAPVVYLNSNIGFSEDNYAYVQNDLVCGIDEQLVSFVVERAARHNIRVHPVDTAQDMYALAENSRVLAIDIAKLGSDQGARVGSGARMNAPKLAIQAAFFRKGDGARNIAPRVHEDSCTGMIGGTVGFSSSKVGSTSKDGSFVGGEVNSSRFNSNSLRSQCRMIEKCGKSLSGELAKWLDAELRDNSSMAKR